DRAVPTRQGRAQQYATGSRLAFEAHFPEHERLLPRAVLQGIQRDPARLRPEDGFAAAVRAGAGALTTGPLQACAFTQPWAARPSPRRPESGTGGRCPPSPGVRSGRATAAPPPSVRAGRTRAAQ